MIEGERVELSVTDSDAVEHNDAVSLGVKDDEALDDSVGETEAEPLSDVQWLLETDALGELLTDRQLLPE